MLIYLLLADRDIEIVADRGINGKVGTEGWERICAVLEKEFRAGLFEYGVIKGIQEVSQVLDVPVGTVKSRVSRGRSLMRAALQTYAREKGIIRS